MEAIQSPTARARPSGWWYVVVPLIVVMGIASAIQAGFGEASDLASSFERLGADGTATVTAEDGDRVSAWAVYDSGSGAEQSERPRARVTVTAVDGGPVAVQNAGDSSETTYEVGSESGIEVASFVAPADGDYEVTVVLDTPAGAAAVPTAAVGTLDILGRIGRVLRPLGWSMVASVAWFVGLMLLRRASRRRLRTLPHWHGPAPTHAPTTTPSSRSGAMPRQDPPDSLPENSGPFL